MEQIFYDRETVRFKRDWLHAKGYAKPGSAALTFAKNYAMRHGRAVVWNCTDDSALIFERGIKMEAGQPEFTITQRTLKSGEVAWDWPGKNGKAA